MQYETLRLEVAPDFSNPICAGTLEDLDRHVGQLESRLEARVSSDDAPIRVYWLSDGVTNYCSALGGCFYAGTRVVFSTGRSLRHELVHAVMDTEGDAHFVEEGVAELYSGVGVVHDAGRAESSLADALDMDLWDYRKGKLDYPAAAHFMQWVHANTGETGVGRLAHRAQRGAGKQGMEAELADMFERSFATVEEDYRDTAPVHYRGLAAREIPTIPLEYLMDGVKVTLECRNAHTMGPLPDDRPGMYRVFRVRIPEPTVGVLQVHGDVDVDARLVAGNDVDDWRRPEVDDLADTPSGDDGSLPKLEAGTYLLLVTSLRTDRVHVGVRLESPD